jgi:putative hydrolase of the HAD superfamily
MIQQLLLDIDNTLYPPDTGLWEEILQRINRYAAKKLGISLEEAQNLRARKLPDYGTTIRWLEEDPELQHIPIDPKDYMAVVHPQDLSPYIPVDQSLAPYLENLGLPIALFTNAPQDHAQRVLQRLKIPQASYPLFTIEDLGGKGKPEPTAFRYVLGQLGWEIRSTLFVDDHPKSVETYRGMGGPALLIHPKIQTQDHEVLHSIYDLKAFLDSKNGE